MGLAKPSSLSEEAGAGGNWDRNPTGACWNLAFAGGVSRGRWDGPVLHD